MANIYVSSADYTAVAAWQANHVYAAGAIVRPTAATANSERCYRTTAGGTSGASEPSAAGGNPWNLSKSGTTTDNTVTWTEITGQEAFQVAGAWAPFARLNTVATFVGAGPRYLSSATVSAGGSGYAVGDVLTLASVAGVLGDQAVVRVATLSGSAVATVTVLSGGCYSGATTAPSASTATTGGGSGATFTLTLLNYAFAAGDQFFVAATHAETQASAMTLTFPGTAASPNNILCVDSSGSGNVPPTATTTGASVTTTGANALTVNGVVHNNGVAFNAGSGAVAQAFIANGAFQSFTSCALAKNGTTGSSSAIQTPGVQTNVVSLKNTTVKFGAVTDSMILFGTLVWRDTPSAVQGATIPTTLFSPFGQFSTLLEGVDLSALGSGKTIVGALTAPGRFTMKDCKLGASVTIAATPTIRGARIEYIRCDSGATNYISGAIAYEGTETTETTIVRTGGATDGTTPVARKIVTTANAKWAFPFEAMPLVVWNDTVGSAINVTVEGVWGGGAVPNNDEVWFDVEYPGSTLTPQGSFQSGTKASVLGSGAALTSSASTWGGSTTKFKQTITVTPQMKGYIYIYPKVGKASTTVYIDPDPVLS